MDSLTHIVLGAATGEVIMGRKAGNKALLWGAIAGSIPDLDSAFTPLFEPAKALFVHRGFSHSILFALIAAPILGWIISKINKDYHFRGWTWLALWAILVHSIIDCFNTYGTGLLEPFSNTRLAFDSLGIIDFLLLIPILVIGVIILFNKQFSTKRKNLSIIILSYTLFYLFFSIGNKLLIEKKVEEQLNNQDIEYLRIKTSPLPITNFLWLVIAEDSDGYHIGYYSNFDKNAIDFTHLNRNHNLLGDLDKNEQVNNLIRFTDGYYSVQISADGNRWLHDLRFGSMAFDSKNEWFVFSFNIIEDAGNVVISRAHPNRSFGWEALQKYWIRIFRDI